MRTPTRLLAALLVVVTVCVPLTACGGPTLEYVPNGASYSMSEAENLAEEVSLSSVEDVKTSDGAALRKEMLLKLREAGPQASALADKLTRDFPSDTSSVPLLVESATVDGNEVWLVVEAWGDADATLAHRRLWVIDRSTLAIVGSSSFN